MAAPVTAQLCARFSPQDLAILTASETNRFLRGFDGRVGRADPTQGPSWNRLVKAMGWELLYRLEPQLYERLTAGERVHPDVMDWLPDRINNAVEVGAGSGRLTLELAPRCRRLLAVEPAQTLADRLKKNVQRHYLTNCRVMPGFFDDLPVCDNWADLVVAYSAFDVDPAHGGRPGLREMDRVLAPGGLTVIVSSVNPGWLRSNGFEVIDLAEGSPVEFSSASEAVELAHIFYPQAAGEIIRRGRSSVPADLIHRDRQRIAFRGKTGVKTYTGGSASLPSLSSLPSQSSQCSQGIVSNQSKMVS